MSICFCSILKPSFLNHDSHSVSRCRLAPNPNIGKPFRFLNLQIHGKDFPKVRAVHGDGIGVLYPDDAVSDRTAPLEAESEDQVTAVSVGAVGTAAEESHESPTRTRVKKAEGKKETEDGDKESRFKLRNGREVWRYCNIF